MHHAFSFQSSYRLILFSSLFFVISCQKPGQANLSSLHQNRNLGFTKSIEYNPLAQIKEKFANEMLASKSKDISHHPLQIHNSRGDLLNKLNLQSPAFKYSAAFELVVDLAQVIESTELKRDLKIELAGEQGFAMKFFKAVPMSAGRFDLQFIDSNGSTPLMNIVVSKDGVLGGIVKLSNEKQFQIVRSEEGLFLAKMKL